MRTVGCKDVGVDCSYGAMGVDDAEVLAVMYAHVQQVHPGIINKTEKEALLKMIEKKIYTLLAEKPVKRS